MPAPVPTTVCQKRSAEPEEPDITAPVLSVVVPAYDEAEVLPLFAQRLRPVLDDLGEPYEVLVVDDGSTDATPALLERLRREWPSLRVVRLRANSGHQAALTAGLARARGDWVASIDADLQDPPEVLGAMLQAARSQGVDVVYGVRTDRTTDSVFKRTTASLFYRLIRRLAGTSGPAQAGDFRLMSRATVDAVNTLPEANRVLRLVVPALGFPSTSVGYAREVRAAGRSKYPLARMLRLSVDGVTGFSIAPLRIATWFGLLGGVAAIALLLYAFVAFLRDETTPGWTSTFVVVAAVGAVRLLCLGLLGEYVGRMYTRLQGRPTYHVAYDSAAPPAADPQGRRQVTSSETPGSERTGR
ncbi:glucosyl transferase [Angustibacter aerolatus]|uniref:Glucosyl transferase n=1 Tax=Angustibacter aerolatus TaxID=1162965 RepID=A0ABQ6JET6_9ACTN|nr:glucosyl transferase [Angustibacter aerolatus]